MAVSVTTVPAAAPAFTCTTKITVPTDPAGAAGAVHVVVPVEPTTSVGVQVVPPGTVRETNVVFAGTVSTSDGLFAVPVPTLVATCVYVMSLPATTGLGEATFVTVISAVELGPTTVDALAVLLSELGSLTDELAVAVSVMTVPLARPVFTFTTIENVAAVLPVMLSAVQTTFPVAPMSGVTQLQPVGAVTETNVVFAGTACTSVALSAALGPLLVRTCVNVRLLPDVTGSGDATLVTLRSAEETTLAMSV